MVDLAAQSVIVGASHRAMNRKPSIVNRDEQGAGERLETASVDEREVAVTPDAGAMRMPDQHETGRRAVAFFETPAEMRDVGPVVDRAKDAPGLHEEPAHHVDSSGKPARFDLLVQ